MKTKDEEINKLNKIRDELESEVQELTASLFEEAHKMVVQLLIFYGPIHLHLMCVLYKNFFVFNQNLMKLGEVVVLLEY